MANIVDDQGNYVGPPAPSRNYGGYVSPHTQRERAARNRPSNRPSSSNTALYAGQRAFALEQMARHGIKVPHGVDPVAYYQHVASGQIFRETHAGLYKPKPAGMTAGPPGSQPGATTPQGHPPPPEDGTDGKAPTPTIIDDSGLMPSSGGGAAGTNRLMEGFARTRTGADVARGSSPAAGGQADAYKAQASFAGGGVPARSTSPVSGGAAGGRPPDPVAEAAKHKLALGLLVSALSAQPPPDLPRGARRR